MGKKGSNINQGGSFGELKKLLKQQTTNKNINRIRCLLYLKESKFRTRKELK